MSSIEEKAKQNQQVQFFGGKPNNNSKPLLPDYINKTMELTTKYCGKFKIYIQGSQTKGKVAFLTVHDVGSNHLCFCDFVASDVMKDVANSSVWFHVCLPGQDDYDDDLPNQLFPSLDAIAHDLIKILEAAQIKAIIGFGEGAGANILCRFGLMYPNRCLGLVLVNATCSGATVDERLHSTVFHFVDNGKKFMSKFRGLVGHEEQPRRVDLSPTATASNQPNFDNNLNPRNVEKYFDAYTKRSDLSKFLAYDLNVDCFIVTGKLSPYKQLCEDMLSHMDKIRTTLLVVDDVYDVLYESRKDFVRSLILFCKGCGVLIGVPMLGLEREFSIVKKQSTTLAQPTEAQKQLTRQIQLYETLLYEHE